MIEIVAVGGYDDVGKNMTLIRVDNEAIICDMGIHLENYIRFTEDEDILNISAQSLTECGAIPDIKNIEHLKKFVKAIVPTHAHLDHVGALPYLAKQFKAPIICTPFTSNVIKTICRNERIRMDNEIKVLNQNSHIKISDNITIEFISVTHSTPQTILCAIHTKYGAILYANDFKFDFYPTLGQKPNLERLNIDNVIALIVDSTYSNDERKMPSESVAKQMLKDVMLGTYSEGKAVIVSTFSSHLARLKSILQFAEKMNRKPLLLGRSLCKYIDAGEKSNIIDFRKYKNIAYRSKINAFLKQVMKDGPEKYLLIVTGHQGEPKAVLSRMADGATPFEFKDGDFVIFSCKTIPTEVNQENRRILEDKLHNKGVRLFKNIHVSGHAAKQDLKDLLLLTKPKMVIPAHGNEEMKLGMKKLCDEMNIKSKILSDGDLVKIE